MNSSRVVFLFTGLKVRQFYIKYPSKFEKNAENIELIKKIKAKIAVRVTRLDFFVSW